MVTDKNNQNSILNIITLARENARSVQEHIPKDLWQCLNEYYHTVKDPKLDIRLQKEDPITVLDVRDKTGNALLWYRRNYDGAWPGPQLYEYWQVPGARYTIYRYPRY
jgi:hypothetical protein